ncbi:hypothetical protein PRUPE_3G235400 [Prunus persica]|uniref:Uncharacterized protein n=1 Tax=Prunus persica TaxID=3760 RepID=A0A251Q7T8_PRUPE|nr:hypothetical protein PRUPE_3G235400 [Prunus persica]
MAKTLSQIAPQIASPSISPLTSPEIFPIYNTHLPNFLRDGFASILQNFNAFLIIPIVQYPLNQRFDLTMMTQTTSAKEISEVEWKKLLRVH